MRVLYLGPYNGRIICFLESKGCQVVQYESKISSASECILNDVNIIVSYGYRYIIPSDVVHKFSKRIINLHISYLPWNKGADPNLWSFLEDTPKGVSIHFVDEYLDTGNIIVQKPIQFDLQGETLRTTYHQLCESIESLFIEYWDSISNNEIKGTKQIGKGTFHTSKEKNMYAHLLKQGWDTPLIEIIGKGKAESNGRE